MSTSMMQYLIVVFATFGLVVYGIGRLRIVMKKKLSENSLLRTNTTVPASGPFRTAPPLDDGAKDVVGPVMTLQPKKLVLAFKEIREVVCPACDEKWKWWYLPQLCTCNECDRLHFHQKHAYVDAKDGKGVTYGKVPYGDEDYQGCGFEWLVYAKHVSTGTDPQQRLDRRPRKKARDA